MNLLDIHSFSSFYVKQVCNEKAFGEATCFLYRVDECDYLVTNWHVVSGRHLFSKELLSKSLFSPEKLLVRIHILDGESGAIFSASTEIDLYDPDGKPKWFIHPRLRNNCDIAILQVSEIDSRAIRINKIDFSNLSKNIGNEVFVIGYPFGLKFSAFPVWKRASIATELALCGDNSYFLVDTATQSGMSGSPIIYRSLNGASFANGSVSIGPGAYYDFIGIYSGRFKTEDSSDPQLGIAWPRYLIDEIIAGRVREESN